MTMAPLQHEANRQASRYEEAIKQLDLILGEFKELAEDDDTFPQDWVIECAQAYLRYVINRSADVAKPLITVSRAGAINFTWTLGGLRVDVLIADGTVQACASEGGRVQHLPPSQVDRVLSTTAA